MRVLVISPHPDDESIGCGGTVRKHVVEGDTVEAIFLTSGEKGGHGRQSEDETKRLREQEARTAAELLGIAELEFFHLPDGKLQATPQASARLRQVLLHKPPGIVYVPHANEMHADHKAAVQLVKSAMQDANGDDTKILMYEIWTPLQQIDEIVDITPYVDTKRAAIRAHSSQCDVMDFEAAALGLNRYRGEMHSWPGGDYAEVFSELHLRNGSSHT